MRQWDGIERMASIRATQLPANVRFHGPVVHELRHGEFPYWHHQCRFEECHLGPQPACTVLNFLRTGESVTALGFLAGKTPTHCRHIEARAQSLFINPTGLLEPLKQRLASGPGERLLHDGL